MDKRSGKKKNTGIKNKTKVNTADVIIILTAVVCLVGIFCRSSVLKEAKRLTQKDSAVITLYAADIDEAIENAMVSSTPVRADGSELGTLNDGWSSKAHMVYTMSEDGEPTGIRSEGKIDLTCTVKISGMKTDNGFILPDGRIVRVNDTVKITGRGFEFEATVTQVSVG